MDEKDREILEAAAQATGAITNGLINVMLALMRTLIDRGVLSQDDLLQMLSDLEVTVRDAQPASPPDAVEQDLNLNDPWDIVCERAGLEDLRIHDARHIYASRALALGESLPMIGRLLGHTQVETTARYAHLAEDSLQDSAVRIFDSIAADLLASDPEPGTVVG